MTMTMLRQYQQMKMELQENCSIRCGMDMGSCIQKTVMKEKDAGYLELRASTIGENSAYKDFMARIIAIRTEYELK